MIFQEITAHSHYSGLKYGVAYWRTASNIEIDFVLGDHEVAIEVKATERAQPAHLAGLRAFLDEYRVRHALAVTLDPRPRKDGRIDILPWETFLRRLWSGEWIR